LGGQLHAIVPLPLSMIAKMLNLRVTIIDNRKNFAHSKRFPHVDKITVGNHAQKLAKMATNPETLIMIVTQGNEYDFACLKAALKSKAGYVGVISSKPKRVKFFNRLKALGFKEKDLKRINIPAGIDIGAQTPQEIAVSIAAEIISYLNKSLIGTDKFRAKKLII